MSSLNKKFFFACFGFLMSTIISKQSFENKYPLLKKRINGSSANLFCVGTDSIAKRYRSLYPLCYPVRECAFLTGFRHSAIVPFLEIVFDKHRPVPIFQHCGTDLFQLSNTFGLAQTLDIVYQIAHPLASLHKVRLVYSDLKLDNVLLDKNGKVWLCDMGDCQWRFLSKYPHPLWTPEEPYGSIAHVFYRAPEIQDCSSGYYTDKIDIWALGVVFFQLLEGKPVRFDLPCENSASEEEQGKAVRADMFRRLALLQVPEAVMDLLQAMLQEDPQKRISAQDILTHKVFEEQKCFEPVVLLPPLEVTSFTHVVPEGKERDALLEKVFAHARDKRQYLGTVFAAIAMFDTYCQEPCVYDKELVLLCCLWIAEQIFQMGQPFFETEISRNGIEEVCWSICKALDFHLCVPNVYLELENIFEEKDWEVEQVQAIRRNALCSLHDPKLCTLPPKKLVQLCITPNEQLCSLVEQYKTRYE